ncbi:MAG: putative lipoic acid-binding regulatory protein [Myxococcota bacterium]|jgi:putative lipoic acid-binding regulatory protein
MSENNEKRFEELLTFPCLFVFRVIAHTGEETRLACEETLRTVLSRPAEGVEVKPSTKGNYQVIRLGVTVISADEIRSLYDALNAVEGVRMVL